MNSTLTNICYTYGVHGDTASTVFLSEQNTSSVSVEFAARLISRWHIRCWSSWTLISFSWYVWRNVYVSV